MNQQARGDGEKAVWREHKVLERQKEKQKTWFNEIRCSPCINREPTGVKQGNATFRFVF